MDNNIIEGRNPILEALKAGRPINKILISKNIERHGAIAQILHMAENSGVPVEHVEKQTIDRHSSTFANQGIIAFTIAKEYVDIDDLLEIVEKSGQNAALVILDGLEDPYNLGAIIRTSDAGGIHGIIVREKRAVGLTATVEKASAGALEYVPVCRVKNITQTLDYLKSKNIWIVGVDQSASQDFTQVDYNPPTAIVIGSEGKGISDLVKKNCDFVVSIPMKGKISSLNASVAAAVVIYEIVKQRK